MKFTVIWQPKPLRVLADLWTAGPDRGAIAAAADRIDEILAFDPMKTHGIVRSGNFYVIREYPLGVDFEVQELDCKVIVNSVWRITDLPQN
jgi:hypothetical protein